MELYTSDLMLKTVTDEDINEVARMWEYEKGKDSIIGWCGLDGKPDPHNPERMEIFYMIDKEYRDKGYATQCASALLEYAFETAKLKKVFGGCYKEYGDPQFFIDIDIYEKIKRMKKKAAVIDIVV